MYLNMHLPRSLMNHRGLLGMGLGAYWAIVFVVSFRAHAANELSGREMMKIVGGQTPNGQCTSSSLCKTQACSGCVQVGQVCGTKTIVGGVVKITPIAQQNATPANYCLSIGSGGNCNTTSGTVQMLCLTYYNCDCTATGCVQQQQVQNTQCIDRDPGDPKCTYTAPVSGQCGVP
jgi:hypothetical protein